MKFAERIELIKQYNDGLVTFLEFCINMHMDADQTDAVVLMKAAHVDIVLKPEQMASIMDIMVEKQQLGMSSIPKVVYKD